jgi:hypothetical protein
VFDKLVQVLVFGCGGASLITPPATTQRRPARPVEFWLALANAAIVVGRLLRRAWVSDRWEGRPRRRP